MSIRTFRWTGWRRAIVAWCLLLAAGLLGAQALQPVPALSGRVVDQTGTLDAAALAQLGAALERLERERGAQVVVLMVASTQPEDIASYANRVANVWKIGRRDIGDGVLLLVAKDDRRLRIEVAKSLEGAIPDLAARRIIDEAITPQLRQGNFAAGLQAGIAQIDARVRGENLPLPDNAGQSDRGTAGDEGLPLLLFAAFFVVPAVASVLRGMLGRKLGALATGTGTGAFALLFLQLGWPIALLAAVVAFGVALVAAGVGPMLRGPATRGRSRTGHGGGWIAGGSAGAGHWGGSGGGFGGGFGSGGGGDFGGGGASGDW